MEESFKDPVDRQYGVAAALKELSEGIKDDGLRVILRLLSNELQQATEDVDSYYDRNTTN